MRLGRWGRRHRSLVATAVAILATATVGLAAGLVAVNAEKNHTEQARLAEARQRTRAERVSRRRATRKRRRATRRRRRGPFSASCRTRSWPPRAPKDRRGAWAAR